MNQEPIEYRLICSEERLGLLGSYGVKILVQLDHEFTDIELKAASRARDLVMDSITESRMRNDPEQIAAVLLERDRLIGLFPEPIFVETIPNGYCSLACCRHRPWFVVTTRRGRVTIGWRKRIIEIRWEPSVADLADKVFPQETSTRFDRTIHAWGYEKAGEYIQVLLSLNSGSAQ